MPWGAAIAAGGSLLGGILGSKASSKAAGEQSFAAEIAAQLQAEQYQNTENLVAPWVGQGNVSQEELSFLMGLGSTPGTAQAANLGAGYLSNPYPQFNAPAPFSYAAYQQPTPFSYQQFQQPGPFSFTQQDFQQSPGYQWQLQQGIQSAQNAASATGSPGGGNALRAIQNYGTGLANQDWYNAQNTARQNYTTNYDVALGSYGTNYNTALQSYNTNTSNALQAYNTNYGNAFQTYQQNYNNSLANYQLGYQQNQNQRNALINYLTGSAQLGVNAALGVGQQGVQSASNIGNSLIQAGNAQAAGTVGSAGAWNNAITGLTNNIGGYLISPQGQNAMSGLFGGGGMMAAPGSEISPNVSAALSNAQSLYSNNPAVDSSYSGTGYGY